MGQGRQSRAKANRAMASEESNGEEISNSSHQTKTGSGLGEAHSRERDVRHAPFRRRKGGTVMKRALGNSVRGEREVGARDRNDSEVASEDDILASAGDKGDEHDGDSDVLFVDSEEEDVQARERFENDNPLFAPEVDLNSYQRELLNIDVSLICEPKESVRLVDEAHLRKVKQLVKDHGYMVSAGTISVTLKASAGITIADTRRMVDSGKIPIAVWLIDGLHRLLAVREVGVKSVRVTLWLPAGNALFLDSPEIVSIGAYLNKTTSTSREMSFQDQIHSCVSLARALDCRENVDIRRSKASHLATALFVGKTLGKQKMRQLQRYGMIALRLAQNEELFGVFLEETSTFSKFSLTHIASDSLLGMDLTCFRLGLQCIRQRIETASQSGLKATGRFDRLSNLFYGEVSRMYEEVKKAASYSGKTVDDIMQSPVGKTKITVWQSIRTAMGRFQEVANMRLSADRRISSLKNRLKRLPGVGDYEAEPSSSSDDAEESTKSSSVQSVDDSQHESETDVPEPPKPPGPHSESDPEPSQQDDSEEDGAPDSTTDPIEPDEPSDKPDEPPGNPDEPSDKHPDDPLEPQNPPGSDQITGPVNPIDTRRSERLRNKETSYLEVGDLEVEVQVSPERPTKKRKLGHPKPTTKRPVLNAPLQNIERALRALPDADVVLIMDALGMEVVPRLESAATDDDRFESADGNGFKDDVPLNLPVGYANPVPFVGELYPNWCRLAFRVPSQWNNANPILHVRPFLETLFVPSEHRANVFLNNSEQVLRDNHQLVFWRAALNYFEEHADEMGIPQNDERFADVEASLMPWACAMAEDFAGVAYFAEKRMELECRGYCVLDKFVDDEHNPGKVGTVTVPQMDGDQQVFSSLRKDVQDSFPGPIALREVDNRKVWNWIVNEGLEEDYVQGEKGIARYTTTNFGVTTYLEQDAEKVQTARRRACLDVRICQAMAALVPWKNKGPGERMFVPKSGGRWLMTAEGCKRQTLHTDFPSLSRADNVHGSKSPGYFTITTGEVEVPIWTCPFSHSTVSMAPERSIRAMSMGTVAGIVRIPPHSIFVGRGDMFHAGAAFVDSIGDGSCLRYHLYFVPSHHSLVDGVHMLAKFAPVWKKNFDDDTDEDCEVFESDQEPALASAEVAAVALERERVSDAGDALVSMRASVQGDKNALGSEGAPSRDETEDVTDAPQEESVPNVQLLDIEEYEEESN